VDGFRPGSRPFEALIEALRPLEHPVVGCRRKSGVDAHDRVECLGTLSEEHLISLSVFVPRRVQLNATLCGNCRNAAVLPVLRSRVANLMRLDLDGVQGSVELVEKPDELEFRERACNRRAFFRFLGRGTLTETGRMVRPQHAAGSAGRAAKYVPRRRALLAAAAEQAPASLRAQISQKYFHRVVLDQTCTACPRCAAMCPTGALKREREGGIPKVVFHSALCTGCGLCPAFCPSGSLYLSLAEPGPTRDRLSAATG
jgi:ferredoxin